MRRMPTKLARVGRFCIVAASVWSAALSVPSVRGAAPPEPIRLRHVLWQALPEEVQAVYVGPDGRVWYELAGHGLESSSANVRGLIEQQFRSETPQLAGIRPVLFEPGGRIWFVTESRTKLFGYDGESWIERAAPQGHHFTGNCAGHGRQNGHGANRVVAGCAFFLDSEGVHVYADDRWTYQEFCKEEPNTQIVAHLLPMRESGDVMAGVAGPNGAVWRWHNGEWSRIERDFHDTAWVVPWSEERIWVQARDRPLGLATASVADGRQFSALLEQLKYARDDRTRDDVALAMVDCGRPIKPQVEQALSETYDPDLIALLVFVLRQLDQVVGHLTLGPYELSDPYLRYCDDEGAIYIESSRIAASGKTLGAGLLMADRAGRITVLADPRLAREWAVTRLHALPVPGNDDFWIPGSWFEGAALVRHRDSGDEITRLPEPGFNWLHVALPDGRLFVSRREPLQGEPVMVCTPGAPDVRSRPAVQTLPLNQDSQGAFCVGSDGVVWADSAKQGVVRFDGVRWEPVADLKSENGLAFLPGLEGTVLIREHVGRCVLLSGGTVYRADNMFALVREARDVIARVFRPPFGARCESILGGISVDRMGNIWVMDERRLKVLVGDEWLDAKGPLLAAGARAGEMEYLNTVGDASRVYVTDFMLAHDHGRSFFGRVEGDQLVFEPAPHTCESPIMALGIKDAGGALWVPGSDRVGGTTCDAINGQIAHRLSENGPVQNLKNTGWARLCERNGTIWLGEVRGQSSSRFNLWRDGEIVGAVKIDHAKRDTPLVSDRPGSVYAWTAAGLQHYTRRPGAAAADYELTETVAIDGYNGMYTKLAVSDLGYLVVGSFADDPVRAFELRLIRLPGSSTRTDGEAAETHSGAQP
jgi:hypothetical protein